MVRFPTNPGRDSYDVVIVGGAIMGSALAWNLAVSPHFNGSVLVVERDPRYADCSTAHTNSCIRQQFGNALNIRLSQYTAEVLRDFPAYMGDDARVPHQQIQSFGYLYLAGDEAGAARLRHAHAVQLDCGVPARLMTPEEIAACYPFYALDDVVLGSHNTRDEGYWDGGSVFEWFRRKAREKGVEYVAGEVTGLDLNLAGTVVEAVRLAGGEHIGCGTVVNAAGPRAARVAAMAGREIPVEPRKRFSWVFKAERPLSATLPLTIDPSGVHVRQDGPDTYLAGGHTVDDPPVDADDFAMDADFWMDVVWPALAARIPAFEAIRVVNEWTGHYAFNVFDRNAILGPDPEVGNILYMNGFSGHGLQQAPAMGRGLAEWIALGGYRTLDLRPFHIDRILRGERFDESAVI
ncbi:FAD-binding oxidoreductase [Salibaculum sp.]|uniref:NAD(P)/FAD-dependent oxidoreductase n=1 Tax=Salibaculum sp. TaxID=2855480 RepID=UPI002B490EF3|nr:FAD-binding oxidoreductase [Salibaculum sp.]HKL69945.1 FAD-binding oxidoreductase [Salibaculum sp.]